MSEFVLEWARRYFQLEVHEYDDLALAVGVAQNADQALICMEVWDDDGYRRLSPDEVRELADELERQRPPAGPSTEPIFCLYVEPPPGIKTHRGETRTLLNVFSTIEEANAEANRLRGHLGDRVVVEEAS